VNCNKLSPHFNLEKIMSDFNLSQKLRGSIPDLESTQIMDALADQVLIFRDEYGIPHVQANSVEDAFFGQGFVTAQDRLWQMDFDRRRAYGRWSEFAGKIGLEQDIIMRRFGIKESVRNDFSALNADTKSMLDSYSKGVNAFINSTDRFPAEYEMVNSIPEEWDPVDSLAVFKVRHILMGVFEGKLWRAEVVNSLGSKRAAQFFTGYQQDHLLIIPPGENFEGQELNGSGIFSNNKLEAQIVSEYFDSGSNSWAINGDRSYSGKPLLAGDPHRGLDVPNVYYQNHVKSKEFDVIGLSFPGVPGFPHFGHNGKVAWSVTHANSDYQDLYVEKFSSNGTRYEFDGALLDAEIAYETIKVRGFKDQDIKLTKTHHGPVIFGDPEIGHGISFKYTATDSSNLGFQCIREMNTVENVEQMDESMRQWVDPCNNFVFVDSHGEIAYLHRGKVPIRASENAWLPVSGINPDTEWTSEIPFEELPRIRSPKDGIIVTANNKIVGEKYPYYLNLDYSPEYRARRIFERIVGMSDVTVDDMSSIHSERISIPAQTYTKEIDKIKSRISDPFILKIAESLVQWNCSMDPDLYEPTIYSEFRKVLHKKLISSLMGEDLSNKMFSGGGRGAPRHLSHLSALFVSMVEKGDESFLPEGQTWDSIILDSFNESVLELRNSLGETLDNWVWGEIHQTNPRHTLSDSFPKYAQMLNPPSIAMGGDSDTPQAAGFSFESYVVTGMSVARYVFDTSNWDNSKWVVPLGSSGHPGSKHYSDQSGIWGEIRLIPMLYGWDTIKQSAETTQILNP